MFFSKTCEYALRAVFFIAQKSEHGRKVGIREIAAGIDSPEPFIAKILQDLSKRGLIQSAKGPTGGFYTDAETRNNTLADIVSAVDGDRLFTGCGLGLQECSAIKPCPVHAEFAQIRDRLSVMLHSTTITHFNEELNLGLSYIKERQ
ncbi:RrF2 family transcriptional regulator [Salmonirosea aquatica]|uniref:Rrf2 family transcriptional regulator n=1 Tax=Salmonirosea aquatica TaxID=2654236 RepID=A0A7C9FY13_9BACT|nr:Rrf2 family transcriptional regulator [Cytophagaceae bacterium SJW1-29]